MPENQASTDDEAVSTQIEGGASDCDPAAGDCEPPSSDGQSDGEPCAPTDEIECYCHLGGVMDVLSSKYAIQVICVVGALEPVRYAEIESAFGDVSSSTLSTRLSELFEEGLLEREQYDEIPPRVEYSLTEDGEALCERLEPLVEWAQGRDAGTK